VTIQENAAVGLVDTRLRSFPHAEIFFGDFGDARVKLDRVDRRVRQKAAEIGQDRTAADAEHQRAVDFLRINCSDAHGARVEHRQIVGIRAISPSFRWSMLARIAGSNRSSACADGTGSNSP